MSVYIHQRKDWPRFRWDKEKLSHLLAQVRHRQGKLLGRMEAFGFSVQAEAFLATLTSDVVKSSEIEGEVLNEQQVRSSIARKLGMDIAGLVPAERHVEGVVEMMLDATQNYDKMLDSDRLFSWHTAMFPGGRSGMQKIVVGAWRDNTKEDPMQVVSGPMGREIVHFEAPAAEVVDAEMERFFDWFNKDNSLDPVVKAAIAHLWFVTIHPFDDGNGRLARAITDMQLARADESTSRFYSMSSQIRQERNAYYKILEDTQKESLDITDWVEWFLQCVGSALKATDTTLAGVLLKANFWKKYASMSFNTRQQTMLNKLLDGFDGKLTSSKWAKITKCSQDTAGRDISDLLTREVLIKEPSGGRSTSYALQV